MRQDDMRSALINAAIQVIARDGLDKATTKLIAGEAGVNEVYIYRVFKDKDDLFVKTFEKLDDALVNEVLDHLPVMNMKGVAFADRCWILFSFIWRSMLSNSKNAITYIRYFYSPYFAKYSMKTHLGCFEPCVQHFEVVFKQEANVWMILNHILNTMLDFVIRINNGELLDNEESAEHVFRIIFASAKQYFREDIQEEIKS